MMKQKLFLLFALLLCTLVPHSVLGYSFSAVAPTGQTLYYNIVNTSTHTVSVVPQYSSQGYDSSTRPSGVLEIPASVTYDGTTYSVISIGYRAFESCAGLTSVTIPNSVTGIGNYAFRDCTGLTGTLSIPNSVISIGEYGFYHCTGLTSVTIGNSVTSIGSYAFQNCMGLTGTLSIPNSVISIGEYGFYHCTGLTSVTIGNSVTSIGSYAFQNCMGLTGTLTIPNSVINIGEYGFYGCTGLTSVTIGNSVTSIGSHAFQNCMGLTGTLTIPNSVTSIGTYAFYDCKSLTSITIPNSVTSIGQYAFYMVNNVLYNGSETGCPWGGKNCNGYIEDSLIYSDATKTTVTGFVSGLTVAIIPNSVTSIGTYAFYDCTGLLLLDLGSGLTSVGSNAFYNCDRLERIYSRSTTPPTVSNVNAFENVWKGLPLTVPTGSRSAYAIAYAWRDFTNIVEDANLGIDNPVETDGAVVTARNGRILVSGAEGHQVTLSDALGHILYRGTATEPLTVEAPATGIYLLQVEGHPAHRISVVR